VIGRTRKFAEGIEKRGEFGNRFEKILKMLENQLA
jgi:hypothetical protein